MNNKSIEVKPLTKKDLNVVSNILLDWLSKEETDYYVKAIRGIVSDSSNPTLDSHYYIALLGGEIVGVAGFRELNPKLFKFAFTKKPAELCMLYVSKKHYRKQGIGTTLLNFVITQVKKRNYKELMVRSAEKFIDTGWGFYDRMGFDRVGKFLSAESKKISQIFIKKF